MSRSTVTLSLEEGDHVKVVNLAGKPAIIIGNADGVQTESFIGKAEDIRLASELRRAAEEFYLLTVQRWDKL